MRHRVLHVITRLDKGGSAENTIQTVLRLPAERYKVVLATGLTQREDDAWRDVIEGKGVSVVEIPDLVRRVDPWKDIRAFCALLRLVLKGRYHIVHTHSSKAGILGRWAAWLAGVPVVIHTPHGHVFYGYFGRAVTACFVLAERLTALVTARIVTLTEQGKWEHVEFGVGRPDKFVPIHSGVDFSPLAGVGREVDCRRAELGIPEGAFVVGSIGRLVPVKGHAYLIEAAALVCERHPKAFFVLVGDGELREELTRRVNALGLGGSVRFAGWRDDVAAMLAAFDLFVLPSLNEGMGKVLVEAMALGVPVLATQVGGVPGVVEHGVSGWLVPPRDVAALAEGISKLIENEELRRGFHERGRLRALKFSVEAMLEDIDALYQRELSLAGCIAQG